MTNLYRIISVRFEAILGVTACVKTTLQLSPFRLSHGEHNGQTVMSIDHHWRVRNSRSTVRKTTFLMIVLSVNPYFCTHGFIKLASLGVLYVQILLKLSIKMHTGTITNF